MMVPGVAAADDDKGAGDAGGAGGAGDDAAVADASASSGGVPSVRASDDFDNQYKDAFEKFNSLIELVELPGILSGDLLRGRVDRSIFRMALYRTGDRANVRWPARLYDALEQVLVAKLMATERYVVRECSECRQPERTRIIVTRDTFKIEHETDLMKRLGRIGESIDVDAFFLWDAFQESDKIVLNTRIVRSDNGEILWAKQYLRSTGRIIDPIVYVGLWGNSVTRRSATEDGDAAKVHALVNLGVRIEERTTLVESLYYAVGADVFFNPSERDKVTALGFAVSAELALELDRLLGRVVGQYGNWLAYSSVGAGYVFSGNFPGGNLAPVVMAGLKLRVNRFSHISAGFVYLPGQTITMSENAAYERRGDLGAIGANANVALRF